MKDRILIDTSAWIESFKKTGNKNLQQLIIKTLDSSQVATTNIVILELLQGCRDKKEYAEMKLRLESLELLPANGKVWDTAYNAGYNLKKNGITIPTIDLIIASIAKAYDYTLIHHDRYFKLVTKHLDLSIIDFIDEQ
ncbi:MAG: PIN domain nuclease [Candidatus Brocadia sp.]|nr:PIN domain nuclease [Candidatus Brocadia sp.]